MKNPYENINKHAFWSTGVAGSSPLSLHNIYQKKWALKEQDKIATAGSCFAQHISRYMRAENYNVLDLEPPPQWIASTVTSNLDQTSLNQKTAQKFGYRMYSARFGNIYTVHQLLQLVHEAFGFSEPKEAIWEKDGRYFDALRPSVEPCGLASAAEVQIHRQAHLAKVRAMFLAMDVFVFTLGLTESWVHKDSGTIYPTAPGTIAGSFSPDAFAFKNFRYGEIMDAFLEFEELLRKVRKAANPVRILLTVSPVPLTATAAGRHVLQSTVYSKSVLRAVAGELEEKFPNIDYFPSFEIVTNPASRGVFYNENLRTVRNEGVEVVMKHFFGAHGKQEKSDEDEMGEAVDRFETLDSQCEEYLLEQFNS